MVVELFLLDGIVEEEIERVEFFLSFIVKGIVDFEIVSVSGEYCIVYFL